MEIPKLAIDKESKNRYHIYLFYVAGKWWAFGYSAYYVNLMYPELEATAASSEHETCIPYVHVTDSFLLRLSAFYNTLVGDEYIQVETPPAVYCLRDKYDEWHEKLTVN